jgi:hypothetical protein
MIIAIRRLSRLTTNKHCHTLMTVDDASDMREEAVSNTKAYTFRLPDDLVAGLNAHRARLSRETGVEISLVDVVKKFLQEGLAAHEGGGKKRKT